MKVLLDSTEIEIELSTLKQIGRGGEGIIYSLTHARKIYAIKIYYRPSEELHKKIQAMLGNPPKDTDSKINNQIFIQLAWPIGLCYEGGGFCGFVMPYVDLEKTKTLDFYLDPRLYKEKFGGDLLPLPFKLEIARNLAGVIKLLHSKGHFFIDFKPQNVRVYEKFHLICLIDCDGFSIEGSNQKRYPANGYSSEYIYPEALIKNKPPQELGLKQDLFALSVVIFQLFNLGIHPFSGKISSSDSTNTTDDKVAKGYYPYGNIKNLSIQPLERSVHSTFPKEVRDLFDRSFSNTGLQPPGVLDWIDLFNDVISNQKLQKCSQYPTNASHIHFSEMQCPTCIVSKISPTIVIPSKSKVMSSSGARTSNTNYQNHSNNKQSDTSHGTFLGIVFLIIFFVVIIGINSSNDKNTNVKELPLSNNDVKSDVATSPLFSGVWGDIECKANNLESITFKIESLSTYSGKIFTLSDGKYEESLSYDNVSYLSSHTLDNKTVVQDVYKLTFDLEGKKTFMIFNLVDNSRMKIWELYDSDQTMIVVNGTWVPIALEKTSTTLHRCL